VNLRGLINLTIINTSLFFTPTLFADTSDWQGQFTLVSKNGETITLTHTPTSLKFGSFQTGTYQFSANSILGDFVATADGILNPLMNVDDFTNEVEKLGGTITNTNITLGSNYTTS